MNPERTNAPTGGRSAVENLAGFARQRIAAAHRMEPLQCGCRDPWLCQCHRTSIVRPEAIIAAAAHLARHGLSPRRAA